MGFRTLLFAYIFGGLTFIPLLLAAAWYLQPRVERNEIGEEETAWKKKKDDADAKGDNEDKNRRHSEDAAASGSFAVLRKYDLQAALTALGTKTGNGDNGNGDGSTSTESVSVYQSMYRSVFAGNKPATSTLLQPDDQQDSQATRRKPLPAQVLYIVLRHGHLMLYDTPGQVEVRHVISLAHHNVSLQAGAHDEHDLDEKKIPESDLFIKRTAIVLTPVELPSGALQQANAPPPAKPFFLFSGTNIEKEAFYHALLAARSHPPIPRPLEVDTLIKLQSALHSSAITQETRALNAVIGRVFLAINRTDDLNDFIRFKIEKKLARIQKPAYIPSLRIQSLNMGDAGPLLSNLKLRDLNISGDMTVSADMKYTGGLSLTFLAVARLDLGQRFKARTVDLVLKTSINRLSGPMLLHIKPPPSNRMWFCFEHVPEMEVRVEPVVSERKITYGFVLRAIEERVRTAIAEGLVKPNWDDIPFPFADTRGSHARGGLWRHDGEPDNESPRQSTKNLAERAAKSASVPDFHLEESGVAASTGITSQSEENLVRVRHAATMPIDDSNAKRRHGGSSNAEDDTTASQEKSPLRPKSLRSPSISSQVPSVAINGQNVEPVRADDASLRTASSTGRRSWLSRANPNQPPPSKDAVEELRDLKDRAGTAAAKTVSSIRDPTILPRKSAEFADDGDANETASTKDTNSVRSERLSDGSTANSPVTSRSFSIQSGESAATTATSSSASTSQTQANQTKRANVIAATVAATTAGRNWAWNTIQRNKNALSRPGERTEQISKVPDQPMGRGQPLPPPGVPLPGPQRSLFSGVRRKPAPALPARRPLTGSSENDNQSNGLREQRSKDDLTDERAFQVAEEEFEPWQENSGPTDDAANTSDQSLPLSRTASESSRPFQDLEHSTSQSVTPTQTADSPIRPRSSLTPSPSPSLRKKASHENSRIPVLRSSTGQIPPPLPRRRPASGLSSPARSSPPRSPGTPVDENGHLEVAAQKNNPGAENLLDDSPTGLKVPESQVEAVARENFTAEQASGQVADDPGTRSDTQAGVDVEVPEDVESESERRERLRKLVSSTMTDASAEDKFRRGEDVHERDFERADEETGGDEEDTKSNGRSVTADNGSSTTADRIRERVEWHRGQESSPDKRNEVK
ncbi:unnamed protein product [Zymoseptoria tritici ST99CH_1A5]|uniref:SMP-LTD domain-containing protein n=1 Tax=Zymoseptoria tritici ST99CH_1A5 TaxID=1276529 RepID=A0A1Y6M2C5_ZYMTR|nr:unnamed protein product [Zymoseptoria tritici ST99CH_1A5]